MAQPNKCEATFVEQSEATFVEQIFRYKFSPNFVALLVDFASVHRYDDSLTFREAWSEWTECNSENVLRETNRLIMAGYKGDVEIKMFKSVRYYFKNRSTSKKESKARRKYVNLNKKLLADMDAHIKNVAFCEDFKPAHAYNNFISSIKYCEHLEVERNRLFDNDWQEYDVESKIKKTYKNRYFIQQKNMLK